MKLNDFGIFVGLGFFIICVAVGIFSRVDSIKWDEVEELEEKESQLEKRVDQLEKEQKEKNAIRDINFLGNHVSLHGD
jgi:hypothetical protein